jgi:arylsulfatase A-like enzyme
MGRNDMHDRPNIVVFLSDDHGQWATNRYGTSALRTPNMDRIAATGVRMNRAFTPSPVCSPARASFFTGRLPSQHGVHDWINEVGAGKDHPGLTGQTTLPMLLQRAGYETALIGKWHCGDSRTPQPGFNRWFSYFDHQYPHFGTQRFSNQGELVIEQGHQSPLLTRRALDFMRTRDRGKPMFLCVGYVNTHSPFTDQPRQIVEPYRDIAFDEMHDETFSPVHGKPFIPKPRDLAEHREQLAQYYAAVTAIDQQVGLVLDELERGGELDHTIVVYTSDHGHMNGHHGLYCKGNATTPQNFIDESILVPCMLSYPRRLPRHMTSDLFVDHCDLFWTLLDLADVTVDAATRDEIHSPGASYLPALIGASKRWRDMQFCEYGNARMIRTQRFKLIRRYPCAGRQWNDEFFDLDADPRETMNRLDDPALESIVTELSRRLDTHFDRYERPGLSGKDVEHQPVCNQDLPWLRQDGDTWAPGPA